MSLARGILGLVAVCAVVVVLSVAGLVWAFATDLAFSMDGLLLILICLSMGGIFALMLLWIAKDAGWLDRLGFLRKKRATEAPANDPPKPPSAGAAGQGK